MSSHHFVIEGQEPALVISGQGPCAFSLLQQLLEWSPFVLVTADALAGALGLGIKIDAVLSREGIVLPPELDAQEPVLRLSVSNDERHLFIHALAYLSSKGTPAANLVWLDQDEAQIFQLMQQYRTISLVWLTDEWRAYLLPSVFTRQWPAGTRVTLHPLGEVTGLETENLENGVAGELPVVVRHSSGDLVLKEFWR